MPGNGSITSMMFLFKVGYHDLSLFLQDVVTPVLEGGGEWLVLGTILLHLDTGFEQKVWPALDYPQLPQIRSTVEEVLEHFSGSHLHLVIVTDRQSKGAIARILSNTIMK